MTVTQLPHGGQQIPTQPSSPRQRHTVHPHCSSSGTTHPPLPPPPPPAPPPPLAICMPGLTPSVTSRYSAAPPLSPAITSGSARTLNGAVPRAAAPGSLPPCPSPPSPPSQLTRPSPPPSQHVGSEPGVGGGCGECGRVGNGGSGPSCRPAAASARRSPRRPAPPRPAPGSR